MIILICLWTSSPFPHKDSLVASVEDDFWDQLSEFVRTWEAMSVLTKRSLIMLKSSPDSGFLNTTSDWTKTFMIIWIYGHFFVKLIFLNIFYIFFWRARVCWPFLCLCRLFCNFGRCLDLNPESCRSKQARYQLSLPSPYLATHLPTKPPISLLSHPSPNVATHLPT